MVCEPVTTFGFWLRGLAEHMLYTINPECASATMCNDYNRAQGWPVQNYRIGVGLAAPQVGETINLVVIAAPGFPEFAMVNPILEKHKGWKAGNESCLSLMAAHGDVLRYTEITVSYQNLEGKLCRICAKDYQARVIQHEMDHLMGIEFTDRIEEQNPIAWTKLARDLVNRPEPLVLRNQQC